MPAPANNTKANYKSYEAQARMVRAIVAAHPEVKWNYKEIVACYGSDMTEHALNHRFRRLRAHAVVVQEGRAQGLDLKDLEIDEKKLPATQEKVDKNNIAKYFGQSTADGIQFQFRTIKKDAEKLRQIEKNGGDVANAITFGGTSSAPVTPSKPTPARARGSGAKSTGKRRATTLIKRPPSEDEDDMDDMENWSEMEEETPSKRLKREPTRGRRAGTPSRLAAMRADATIADASAKLMAVESPPEVQTPSLPDIPTPLPHTSIFGHVERKPVVNPAPEPSIYNPMVGGGHGAEAYLNDYTGSLFDTGLYTMNEEDYGAEGEI